MIRFFNIFFFLSYSNILYSLFFLFYCLYIDVNILWCFNDFLYHYFLILQRSLYHLYKSIISLHITYQNIYNIPPFLVN
jgi:hypothetical protein